MLEVTESSIDVTFDILFWRDGEGALFSTTCLQVEWKKMRAIKVLGDVDRPSAGYECGVQYALRYHLLPSMTFTSHFNDFWGSQLNGSVTLTPLKQCTILFVIDMLFIESRASMFSHYLSSPLIKHCVF